MALPARRSGVRALACTGGSRAGSDVLLDQSELDKALQSIGTVHYARTLFFDVSAANLQPGASADGPFVLAVITEYDGSFDAYIGDFVKQVGPVFDALLQFVVGGAAVTPVADNVDAFQAFITANDASQHEPNTGLFEAYPYTATPTSTSAARTCSWASTTPRAARSPSPSPDGPPTTRRCGASPA